MEYIERKLFCKTRTADTSPLGKPRVFFCASKRDFDQYFEAVSKDILDILNCAIYYLDYEKEYANDPEIFELLDSMQLFVVPVTAEFFLEGEKFIRDQLLKHYIEKQKMIIPIMVEKVDDSIISSYSNFFGELQFLDRTGENDQAKGTQIPYEKKLETTLINVLVGDQLAEKIREAFDVHIFLSYRKKDRKDAQKLMHLIHSDPACENFAIWYDEKLVPGESFETQIRDKMKNCNMFIFNVTESFLEEGNYVVKIEYPTAKKSEKPIIPVEMRITDKDKLHEMFEGMNQKLINIDEHSKICPMTLETVKNIAKSEKYTDVNHTFFLGLAYLNGIDVETDIEHGERLIRKAAEKGLPEAMEKLAHLSFDGKKSPEIDKATGWQKKAVETYKEQLLQADKDSDQFLRFEEAVKYLLQLYSCNPKSDDFACCIDIVEELAKRYSEKVLEQHEEYHELFKRMEYLRIHAVSLSDDSNLKKSIVEDIQTSYMNYFKLAYTPQEDACTFIDLLCTITNEIGMQLYNAFERMRFIKKEYENSFSDLSLCEMYIKSCRVIVEREKVSSLEPGTDLRINAEFMEDEFGWWKYAKEAYSICSEHINDSLEKLEWKKLYCESLYNLAYGLSKVICRNDASLIDRALMEEFNSYADCYDGIYSEIIESEDYHTKCLYIDGALTIAWAQYLCNHDDIVDFDEDIIDLLTEEEEIVVKKYKKTLAIAKHLMEECRTRESQIYYWNKLIYCTGLAYIRKDSVLFKQSIANEALMIAREMHKRENSIQTRIWVADSLKNVYESYMFEEQKDDYFGVVEEAISIYEGLVNQVTTSKIHYRIEQDLYDLYLHAHNFTGERKMEKPATEYILRCTNLATKMFEEYNKLPEVFPPVVSAYLWDTEYPDYMNACNQMEKTAKKLKNSLKCIKLNK